MLAAELVALAVPPRCSACGAPGRRAVDVLCSRCRRALPWLPADCCERCALPLPHAGRRCPARDAPFDAAWSAVAYEGVARDAMHALKFAAARPLADVMAAQIAANVPAGLLVAPARTVPRPGGRPTARATAGGPGRRAAARATAAGPGRRAAARAPAPTAAVALVAVPAHPARRRARGFDPAELLARALARRTGVPLVAALRRGGTPARQLGASRDVRRDARRLDFSARGLAPQTAVLIDDVHTTGATLAACASALKQAGADRVVALSWARAL